MKRWMGESDVLEKEKFIKGEMSDSKEESMKTIT